MKKTWFTIDRNTIFLEEIKGEIQMEPFQVSESLSDEYRAKALTTRVFFFFLNSPVFYLRLFSIFFKNNLCAFFNKSDRNRLRLITVRTKQSRPLKICHIGKCRKTGSKVMDFFFIDIKK